MKKIVFYDNNLTLRGTSIALYNYADYNEKILGNKSIIIAKPDDFINLAKIDIYYYNDIRNSIKLRRLKLFSS